MNIELDENHRYTVDNKPVPGVTDILRSTLGAPWAASQWHLDRGTAAHACYHLLATGADLQAYDIDPALDGYVAGWRRWRDDLEPEIIITEGRVAHAAMWYAGTMDLVARIGGKTTIIDFKNSHSWQTVYQLAGYAVAWESMGLNVTTQAVEIVIPGDGTYRMGKIIKGAEWRNAKTEWVSIRNTARIIERNGGK